MLDGAPDFFIDNDYISAPPHEPEDEMKDEIWYNILQGSHAEKARVLFMHSCIAQSNVRIQQGVQRWFAETNLPQIHETVELFPLF